MSDNQSHGIMHPIPKFVRRIAATVLSLPGIPVMGSETTEPPLGITFRVNDREIRMVAGKEIEIKREFQDPKVTLVADQHRVFPYGGVTFWYPSNFAQLRQDVTTSFFA